MEKRALPRRCTRIPVACSGLTANSPVLKGKMLNCSNKGTCIELDQEILEGSIVMVKASIWNPEDRQLMLPEGFRAFCLAEVKWSKPIADEGFHNYAIGLRYLPN